MKAYVASSFTLAKDLPHIERILVSAGIDVPDCWWLVDEKKSLPSNARDFYSIPIVQSIAKRHWKAISECDFFVLVSSETETKRFTGANIELGYALALGKPCVIFGQVKNSAMYADCIHCHTVEEFRLVMRDLNYNNVRVPQDEIKK